eukprot:COSAG02_NODE_332_length_24474_cov_23.190949_25_plen_598_part_00
MARLVQRPLGWRHATDATPCSVRSESLRLSLGRLAIPPAAAQSVVGLFAVTQEDRVSGECERAARQLTLNNTLSSEILHECVPCCGAGESPLLSRQQDCVRLSNTCNATVCEHVQEFYTASFVTFVECPSRIPQRLRYATVAGILAEPLLYSVASEVMSQYQLPRSLDSSCIARLASQFPPLDEIDANDDTCTTSDTVTSMNVLLRGVRRFASPGEEHNTDAHLFLGGVTVSGLFLLLLNSIMQLVYARNVLSESHYKLGAHIHEHGCKYRPIGGKNSENRKIQILIDNKRPTWENKGPGSLFRLFELFLFRKVAPMRLWEVWEDDGSERKIWEDSDGNEKLVMKWKIWEDPDGNEKLKTARTDLYDLSYDMERAKALKSKFEELDEVFERKLEKWIAGGGLEDFEELDEGFGPKLEKWIAGGDLEDFEEIKKTTETHKRRTETGKFQKQEKLDEVSITKKYEPRTESLIMLYDEQCMELQRWLKEQRMGSAQYEYLMWLDKQQIDLEVALDTWEVSEARPRWHLFCCPRSCAHSREPDTTRENRHNSWWNLTGFPTNGHWRRANTTYLGADGKSYLRPRCHVFTKHRLNLRATYQL